MKKTENKKQKEITQFEVNNGLYEWYDFHNPIIHPEWWQISWPTLFDLLGKKDSIEKYRDNGALDEHGVLWVDRLRDFETGILKEELFDILETYQIGNITYNKVHIKGSHATFLVDFANRRNFPWFEKWTRKSIRGIYPFGETTVVILGGFDDVQCITQTGKQIGGECVWITHIPYGKIDLLEFKSRVNSDYLVNDLRTKCYYLGSDWKYYRPQQKQEEGIWIMYFEEISNWLTGPSVITLDS